MLLRDRLYIGYLEAADVLEIISYNEAAGRFEFQVVTDYREGATPRVRYARRLVCTACHQNAAPLFARPLWDETNSNTGISGRLRKVHDSYQGILPQAGVDIAYAIDNATDRANEFGLTQKLWQQGCGAGEAGARCRATLLNRTLQYLLSGRRGFDTHSTDYRLRLRDAMHAVRRDLWPQGLLIPNPDIPNRRPLPATVAPLHQDADIPAATWTRRADVNALFDPLAARPPLQHWNPDPDEWVTRAVQGLSQFLANADVQRVDDHLADSAVTESTYRARCTTGRDPDGSTARRIKIDCRGKSLAFRGILYQNSSDDSLRGQLRGVRLAGEDLGTIQSDGRRASESVWQLELRRAGSRYRLRRANADQLDQLVLQWHGDGHASATAELTIRHEGRLLAEAVDALARDDPGWLSAGPFQRAGVLPALFGSLGLEPLRWCCVLPPDLPAPESEPAAAPLASGRLAGFLKVCGGCHRSEDPFPPNFLAGSQQQVLATIAHCGERIQYRLAMWEKAPEERSKTPMPPTQSLSLHEDEGRNWMSGLLPELRKALHEIAALSRPLPPKQVTVARPYYELRPCLPAS